MKTFAKFYSFLLFLLLIFISSCSNGTQNKIQEEQIEFASNQIPGCLRDSSLVKVSNIDSCFDYIFTDTLKIDFCVSGNCCPDSQRFLTEYKLKSDTLFVSVIDTAKNLCDCICNYKIHLEISGLSENQYLFYCNYRGIYNFQDSLKYRELVIRQ